MHLKTTSFAALRLTSKTPICSLAEVMLKHIIGVVKPYAVTAVRFQINCEASRPFVSLDKQRFCLGQTICCYCRTISNKL